MHQIRLPQIKLTIVLGSSTHRGSYDSGDPKKKYFVWKTYSDGTQVKEYLDRDQIEEYTKAKKMRQGNDDMEGLRTMLTQKKLATPAARTRDQDVYDRVGNSRSTTTTTSSSYSR